jgi:hypothetical protein
MPNACPTEVRTLHPLIAARQIVSSLPDPKQALSIFLSISLVFSTLGLDGCKKEQPQSQPTQQAQAPQATYATPTADQLYQLVAPIALFPDNLLAQVLAGSTFPDQITAAQQWLTQNSSLKGTQLAEAVNQESWDPSVKGLTQFPDVLSQMASNLSWTSALGDAYFNIPQSVMNAVQVMRQRAQQSGNLKTTAQQNVTVQNQAPASAPPAEASSGAPQVTVVQPPPQTIVIQPAQPDVVYVPTYNPAVVYGAPVPVYPGYVYPTYSTGAMVATGLISFGLGVAVGAAMSGGCCGWGWNSWGCGWHNSSVTYNRNVYVSNSNTFVNRNNYYNRNNFNNANINNINRNNINANNINRNNFNNNNYRANNFNNNARTSNFTEPKFNQNLNQKQFQNNRGNLAQNNGQLNRGNEPNFNNQNRGNFNNQNRGNQPNFNNQNRGNFDQPNRGGPNQNQNRPAFNQNQNRAGNFNQQQRQPERGYGQQPNRGASNNAFGGYSQGGNARTNSARGQQSLEGNRGGNYGGNRAQAGGGFNGGNRGGGGGARPQPAAREGGGRRR